jgi:membrane protease YdiL (CAAX protease family)
MKIKSHQHISRLHRPDRLITLLEILLVLSPTYVSMVLGYQLGGDNISLHGNLILLGGPFIYLGMILSLVIFWMAARPRGISWRGVGLSRPPSWIHIGLSGVGLSMVMIPIIVTLQELLTSVIPDVVPPDMSCFAVLHESLPNLVLNVIAIWITAGFIEELIWRGYLINRLTDILGKTKLGLLAALFCSAVLFGIAHFYLGLSGILLTGVTGLLFGIAFLVLKRNLWPLVITHGLINTLSYVNMYQNGV